MSYNDIWHEILIGGSPELFVNTDYNKKVFWQNYISEYLDRDVRDLSQVGNLFTFHKFMQLLAAQVGNLFNMSRIANELKINVHTVEHYLSILQTSNIIYILQPYYNIINITNTIVNIPISYL